MEPIRIRVSNRNYSLRLAGEVVEYVHAEVGKGHPDVCGYQASMGTGRTREAAVRSAVEEYRAWRRMERAWQSEFGR